MIRSGMIGLFSSVGLLLLSGCSTSLVGHWRADNIHPRDRELNAPGTIKLHIAKGGTFDAEYTSDDGADRVSCSGDWDRMSGREIRMFTRAGDGPKFMRARTKDGASMNVISNDETFEFVREE